MQYFRLLILTSSLFASFSTLAGPILGSDIAVALGEAAAVTADKSQAASSLPNISDGIAETVDWLSDYVWYLDGVELERDAISATAIDIQISAAHFTDGETYVLELFVEEIHDFNPDVAWDGIGPLPDDIPDVVEHTRLDGITITYGSVSVPAPSTLIIFSSGLFGLGFMRRYLNKK